MADGAGSNGHDAKGRFVAGNSGGPGGSRSRVNELRRAIEEAVTPQHIRALILRMMRMGLEGNLAAARFVVECSCGRAPEAPAQAEPVAVSLPRLRTAADCSAAIDNLLAAMIAGSVDRDAITMLIQVIQTKVKAIELNDHEQRLAELEEVAKAVDARPRFGRRKF